MKPDPSFTISQSSPQQDHIIFNPPSSAPSVYHTPLKFLPKDDRRRQLYASLDPHQSHHLDANRPRAPLPPPVRKPYEKKYHLTAEDVDEIRRLRSDDPVKWSRDKLAAKFECSQLFVGIVCEASKEHKDKHIKITEAVKSKWGRRKQMAREDRVRRRETWGREE